MPLHLGLANDDNDTIRMGIEDSLHHVPAITISAHGTTLNIVSRVSQHDRGGSRTKHAPVFLSSVQHHQEPVEGHPEELAAWS